jgi:hypothetical protein
MITSLGTLGFGYVASRGRQDSIFDMRYWHDAEAKLVAAAIVAYNFDDYVVPRRYRPLLLDDPEEISSFLRVREPLFMPGMA